MSEARPLRSRAEATTANFAALLVRAEQLAAAVIPGGHGRRRAGSGDDFWQYRPVQLGDTLRMVDWRRSARSDAQFVRQKEWQISQSVFFWVDRARSMQFSSAPNLPEKIDRAQLLSLAVAILLSRGGEQIGLSGENLPPRAGAKQLQRFAEFLTDLKTEDYAAPQFETIKKNAFCVCVSDFLGDIEKIEKTLLEAATKGARGVCVQILDPAEESFPFRGRSVFDSVGGTMRHETLQAADLSARYLERLAARKARLKQICRQTGWTFYSHHTNTPAQSAVMWLHTMIEGPK
ncbi:DUF58 domain-containing protein [Lentibacter sp.]|uniref:DUF58 domain-containing protein n=1 Tax=Lentibacter sp. TaxID=2024994 RepID=UPI003F69D1E0